MDNSSRRQVSKSIKRNCDNLEAVKIKGVFTAVVMVIIVAAIAVFLFDQSFLTQIGITNIVAGAATFVSILALATSYFTFLLIGKQTSFIKKQTSILQKQALVWEKKKNPVLEFENLKFVENKIIFDVKNIGNENAYWLGVVVEYWPMKEIKFRGQKDLSIDDKKRQLSDYVSNQKLFSMLQYVNFLSHISKEHIVLKPNEKIHLELEPHFGFKDKKDDLYNPSGYVSKSTNELIYPFSQNGVKYLFLRFSLIYKNLIDEVQTWRELDKFVFVLGRHKNLEEAKRDHFQEPFRQINPYDFEVTMDGASIDFYNIKSIKNENPHE